MFKILVVEDDADLNRTVCAFLNSSGYETTGCLDAATAYDAMYDTVYDLIVSDIMMPGHLGMMLGILLGLAGMCLVALSYPVYNRILQAQRRRIAPQILQLTEELMQ